MNNTNLMAILIGSLLVNNFVLSQFLGICPFLGVSKKLNSAVGMSVAVTFVMMMSTAVTWPVYTYVLVPGGLEYLQTIVFILVIAALVQLVEIALKRFIPPLYKSLGIYLPLITTNCAVLGVTILNIDTGYGFGESLVNTFGAGLGFMLAMILRAYASGWRVPIYPRDSKGCLSPWWRRLWFRYPLSDFRAFSVYNATEHMILNTESWF